jgi:GTP-binding protein HflX
VTDVFQGGDAVSNRAIVLHPDVRNRGKPVIRDADACLAEAVGLAQAIDLDVLHADVLPLRQVRAGTLLGLGVIDTYKSVIEKDGVGVVIIDAPVTPIQQRNLENAWNCKVIDRTGLILEIFGERARTREGRLQVELAHLSYQRSRLVRSWTHLERQRGGFGFLGGPGETQIESDRRQIDERIMRIRRDLSRAVKTRNLHRQARKRVPYPVVALVGYTNAGKSTLFNLLAGAGVKAEDQLFATLDPTMRAIDLPSGRTVILSDTVGFVSELPTMLVAAFRATLEEVLEADLIIHVRDIAHPDSLAQKGDVLAVLNDLGVTEERIGSLLEVRNKVDLLDAEQAEYERNIASRDGNAVVVSAVTGDGTDQLLAVVEDRLNAGRCVIDYILETSSGEAIAWLYQHGSVLERKDDETKVHLTVGLDASDAARFEHRFRSSIDQ